MKVLVTKIKGMRCGSCILTMERLGKKHGAIKVDINLKTSIGKFYFEDMNAEMAILDIQQRGYEIEKITIYEEGNLWNTVNIAEER